MVMSVAATAYSLNSRDVSAIKKEYLRLFLWGWINRSIVVIAPVTYAMTAGSTHAAQEALQQFPAYDRIPVSYLRNATVEPQLCDFEDVARLSQSKSFYL